MKVPGGYVVSRIDLRLKKTILLHLDENSNFKHKNRANTGLKSLDVDKAIYQQMLKWSEELESLKKTVARSPNKIHVIKGTEFVNKLAEVLKKAKLYPDFLKNFLEL